MSTTTPTDDRKRAYHAVLNVVRMNTGYKQPVTCRDHVLGTVLSHGHADPSQAQRARQAALANDHLVRFVDADGQRRYGVTVAAADELPHADTPLYPASDLQAFEAYRDREIASADPRRRVIGWANGHIHAIRNTTEGTQ